MTDWSHFFTVVEQLREHWSASPGSRFFWIYQRILERRQRIERCPWWQHECRTWHELFKRLVSREMPANDWNEEPELLGLTATYQRAFGELAGCGAFRTIQEEAA